MTARPSARREGVGIVRFYSILTRQTSFQDDVLRGLALPQKAIPPKYFYDERGSQLFERICELPEYYPTRTEMALMERHVDEMVRNPAPNFRRDLIRPHVKRTVDLARIHRNDFRSQRLGQKEAQSGFPHCRGADEGQKGCRQQHHLPK